MTEPFSIRDHRSSQRTASGIHLPGANWDATANNLRSRGYTLPTSGTQARLQARQVVSDVRERGTVADVQNKAAMHAMRANRLKNSRMAGGGMQRTGANVQMVLPKVRQPLSSLMDKGIPFNTEDPKELQELRRWTRLFYATHDLVPLLIDIYSTFPVQGMELQCQDKKVEEFFTGMFLDELDYGEFLPNGLMREYFMVGEATSLAHFNEQLGTWSSEELLNPDWIRISKSLFVEQERVQLMPKALVESLRDGPQGMASSEESHSERLERTFEYCLTPGHRVLTADLRWVPVESLVVGDPIMGFDEHPRPGRAQKRQWVPTRVEATKVITGNTYRIKTDGPTVECTDQHRWLAMPQNKWTTVTIDTTHDEEFYPIYEWRGEQLKRTRPWIRRPCQQCRIPMELQPSAAAVTKFCSKTCANIVLNRSYSSGKSSGTLMWLRADEVRPGDKIMFLGQWDMNDLRDAAWMGGFLDGEGSLGKTGLTFSQNRGPVLDRALEILDSYKFTYTAREGIPHKNSGKTCVAVRIQGGWPEIMRALSIFRPVRLLQTFSGRIHGTNISGSWVTVTEVTYVGEQDVIALGTSSKTLIAEGMFTHNTQLTKHYPEIIKAAQQDDGLDISDALVSRMVNKAAWWDLRGTPHLLRSFRTLMLEESLNAAQDAVCDRLYAPLIVATLGIEGAMGDGEPWIPDQGELEDLRDDIQAALAADFKLIVHNFGLSINPVFGRESVPRFDQDYDRVDAKLMQAWGIGQALIMGGSGAGTYASSAINREVCEQLMKSAQNKAIKHMRKRMEVIAEAQEFYDFDLKGGRRIPVYEHIEEYNEETGEKEIVKVPKLLIPDVKFQTLNLRDEATERSFVAQLKQMGVPVSDKSLAINIPFEFEEELERQSQETVDKGRAQAEAMGVLQEMLDEEGLPYPMELAQHLEATLGVRAMLAQTEAAEAQNKMMDQQLAQASPAGMMGLLPGTTMQPLAGGGAVGMAGDPTAGAAPGGPPPPDPAAGPAPNADPTLGQGHPAAQLTATMHGPRMWPPGGEVEPPEDTMSISDIPRNRNRPEESDEKRGEMPKKVGGRRKKVTALPGRGEPDPVIVNSRFTKGPSSYRQSRSADQRRVERAVRRREVLARGGPTVAELVFDPDFYHVLHADGDQAALEADWPEIEAGRGGQSRRLLEELIEQYEAITGIAPRWE